jgi:hypothetical protein
MGFVIGPCLLANGVALAHGEMRCVNDHLLCGGNFTDQRLQSNIEPGQSGQFWNRKSNKPFGRQRLLVDWASFRLLSMQPKHHGGD